MLRDDPIVLRYPEYLPTEEEVELAEGLLQLPENEHLWKDLCRNVAIGGCPKSAMRRFCWQAREDHKLGQECAEGAVAWLRRNLEARTRLSMDTLLELSPFPASFRDLYTSTVPFSFHGTDRQGHPIYIVRYGSVDVAAFRHLWAEGEQLAQKAGLAINAAVLFHLRAMEYLTKVVMAEETERQGRVVDRILTIMDVGGLGLQHLDGTLKNFLGGISKESVPLFPETLHAVVVAHAPWVLSRAAWPLAKRFMHPVTQAKFTVLASQKEVREKLLLEVEPEALPPYLGGQCACAECRSGRLRGGSLWTWEEQRAQALPGQRVAAARPVAETTAPEPEQAANRVQGPQDLRARKFRQCFEFLRSCPCCLNLSEDERPGPARRRHQGAAAAPLVCRAPPRRATPPASMAVQPPMDKQSRSNLSMLALLLALAAGLTAWLLPLLHRWGADSKWPAEAALVALLASLLALLRRARPGAGHSN